MRVKVLSSGSSGNTTYIEYENTKILIDIGNSCKYVADKLKEMRIEPNKIDAILITHTHVDHIKGLKVFAKKYNPVIYATKGILNELDYIDNYYLIDKNELTIGDIHVDVVKTSHDAPDSVGYIINGSDKSLAYITDTGYINEKYFPKLKNKDLYIMESNHDIEMLNNGPYPFKLRQRILGDKGHLSNYDSARYLSTFMGNKTKHIILAHLSEKNNTEKLAYETLVKRLKDEGNLGPEIIIAKQNEETELIEV